MPCCKDRLDGSQVHRAPAERLLQPAQAGAGPERGAMRLLDRRDGLRKKNLRPLDKPIFAAGCFQRGECPLVNPGHIQRLQTDGHGLASQSPRRFQARPAGLAAGVFATPPDIVPDNALNLRFMIYPNSPAAITAACGLRIEAEARPLVLRRRARTPHLIAPSLCPLIQTVYGGNPDPGANRVLQQLSCLGKTHFTE